VTNTRVLDIDQHLIWTRLLYGNLLVLDGSTGLLNYTSPLLLGNLLGFSLTWLSDGSVRHFGCPMEVLLDERMEMKVFSLAADGVERRALLMLGSVNCSE